ncbi:MAG: hypothetical protein QM771_18505 [Nitrospira sp.]
MIIGLTTGGLVLGQAAPCTVWSAEPVLSAGATQHEQAHGALAAEGTVERFILDPRGEVEGLFLAGGIHLYVTSRAADQLVRAFAPGHVVRVYGRLLATERLVQADAVTNVTTGTTFAVPLRLNLPMQEQEHTLSMTEMSAAGTIRAFFYHPLKKHIQGMLLSDESQVRFPRTPVRTPALLPCRGSCEDQGKRDDQSVWPRAGGLGHRQGFRRPCPAGCRFTTRPVTDHSRAETRACLTRGAICSILQLGPPA